MIELNREEFNTLSEEIFTCDSPTGYTHIVIKIIENHIKNLGFDYKI